MLVTSNDKSKVGRGAGGSEHRLELVAVEVVGFYPNAGLALVSRGVRSRGGGEGEGGGEWVEKVVVVERDLWWRRVGDGKAGQVPGLNTGAMGHGEEVEEEASASDDDEEDEGGVRKSDPQKGYGGGDCGAGEQRVVGEGEEEDSSFDDVSPTLDSSAKIKELKGEIEQQQVRLKQERARKLKVYEKQLDCGYKDAMKRVLKKMLLQYHPDKINTLREWEAPLEGTEEEVEAYLKDITQELARTMHSFGAD